MERFIDFFLFLVFFPLTKANFIQVLYIVFFYKHLQLPQCRDHKAFLCKIKQCKATVSYIQPHGVRCARETSYKRVENNDRGAIINPIIFTLFIMIKHRSTVACVMFD